MHGSRFQQLNEEKGLVPGYPVTMRNILGDNSVVAVHGISHKRIRGSLLAVSGPAATRDHHLQKIDKFTRSFLDNWAGKIIDIQLKTKKMIFLVSMNLIIENESTAFHEAFKATFDNLVLGIISLPIKIPGTSYFRALQSRKNVIAILGEVLAKRRASSTAYDDILDQLLRNEVKFSDEEIIDQIITILYSGYETVSTTSMMAVKYLRDHPKALQAMRDEHFAIQQSKKPEEQLNWDDYKNMIFTRAVILETLRLATIVHGLMRKTTTDVQLNGFTVPKDWRVLVYIREINYDPFLYEEPFNFNPWRWTEKDLESHNHNMLFGRGSRMCAGKELGIVKVSLFLHHFVTRYRLIFFFTDCMWEEVEGNKLLKFPRVEAPNGLKLRVAEY
ncbi:hypothetical protein L6164_001912 [Bauhinia variegata]|uniref:Uncharacterized protein n=1 Tax=Bauhinia variegata TaxID=167791 RepID=A0ACB9QB18_BAUVA|nr:hypothetical protein L6164_001912 [Bauhinia variegata]